MLIYSATQGYQPLFSSLMGAVEFSSIVLPALFWPFAVFLIVFIQRGAISKLIGRIRSAEVFGQKFSAIAPEDLEDAVAGGTDSPEVQRVLAEAQAKPSVQVEPSVESDSGNAEIAAMVEAHQTERRLLLEQLSAAGESDKHRRREEIEQVTRMAARWGAEMVLADSDLVPNELAPVIEWQPDGEPHIFARSRRPASNRRLAEQRQPRRALDRAEADLQDLREEQEMIVRNSLLGGGADDKDARDQFTKEWKELDVQISDAEHRVADETAKLKVAEHQQDADRISAP